MEDEVSRTRSELERIAAVVDYTSPSFVNKKAALRAGLDRLQARYNDELQAIEKVVEDVEEFMAVKRAQEERGEWCAATNGARACVLAHPHTPRACMLIHSQPTPPTARRRFTHNETSPRRTLLARLVGIASTGAFVAAARWR